VPDFMPGYVDVKKQSYMNLGYLTSPYPGKVGQGDYAPRRLPPMAYPTGPYRLDVVNYDVLGNIIPHPRCPSTLKPCQ
jgi:hypothetical protein